MISFSFFPVFVLIVYAEFWFTNLSSLAPSPFHWFLCSLYFGDGDCIFFYQKMTKTSKVQRRSDFQHHDMLSYCSKVCKRIHQKEKLPKSSEKKEWEGATCAVCMEHPHNAVLLLCSSYDKGCRPYMCATSYRFSNCLEQYKKAYTKVTSIEGSEPGFQSTDDPNCSSGAGCLAGKSVPELLCPLCRGQVKGWTVVEPARKHLNAKKRTCMHESCSFVGTYKKLRKHVRREHPSARPREVDPSLAEKWKKLEHERELNDVFSTIRSAMPGAIVMGDYVIEGNFGGMPRNYEVDLDDTLFRLESYRSRWNDDVHSNEFFDDDYHSFDEDDFFAHHTGTGAASNVFNRISRHRYRLLLGRSRRRQRHRASTRIQ